MLAMGATVKHHWRHFFTMGLSVACLTTAAFPQQPESAPTRGYVTVGATVKLTIVLPEQKGLWVVDVLIDHKPLTTKVSNVTPVVVEWDTTKYPDGMHTLDVNAMFKDQRVFMQKQYAVVVNDPKKRDEGGRMKDEILFNPANHPNPDAARVTPVSPDEQILETQAWARLHEAGVHPPSAISDKPSAISHQQFAILRDVVEKYPATLAAAEASRWLGERHFDRDEWEKAAEYLNQYAVWSCLIRSAECGVGREFIPRE